MPLGANTPWLHTCPSRPLCSIGCARCQPALPRPIPNSPWILVSGHRAVRRFLGERSKKRGYLAHANTLDRDMTCALIKTVGLDEIAKMRVTQKAQAMGRFFVARNIVAVFNLMSVHSRKGG